MKLFSLKSRVFAVVGVLGVLFSSCFAEDVVEKQETVLITGANRGIGLEYAKQYSEKGYKVYGTARKPEEAVELKKTGAEILKLDVLSDEDIAKMAKVLEGKKIDVLINNAAVMYRTEITREAMGQSFEVNTLGPLYVSKALVPLVPNLKLSENPRIINISSSLGILKNGKGRPVAYSVSKTGLNMVTRVLHTELADSKFIVISLDPGWNKTDMGGEGATFSVEETVPQMIKVIGSLKSEDAGKFYNYKRDEKPW